MQTCCKDESNRVIYWKSYETIGKHYHIHCSQCGSIVKRLSKSEVMKIDTASIVEYPSEYFDKKRRDEYEQRHQAWQKEMQDERDKKDREWLAWYEKYLESEAWQQKRGLVLKRANWMCEGCGKNRANQVHHLTYERVGDEMLFDLVAICKECHDKIPSKFRSAA
jgi:5-methylcytosine-specific restriction endonuclease McrA